MDVIVCNSRYDGKLSDNAKWVYLKEQEKTDQRIYLNDLADKENPLRHDSGKLAHVLMELYNERTGPIDGKG